MVNLWFKAVANLPEGNVGRYWDGAIAQTKPMASSHGSQKSLPHHHITGNSGVICVGLSTMENTMEDEMIIK